MRSRVDEWMGTNNSLFGRREPQSIFCRDADFLNITYD